MMHRLLVILFFILLSVPGNSQLIPTYFKNPAFKAWVRENKISSLTSYTLPTDHLLYTEGYYYVKNSQQTFVLYPKPTKTPLFEVKMSVYEFLFDESGNLDSMSIKTLEVNCSAPEKDSFQMSDDFRAKLNELIDPKRYISQLKIDTTGEHISHPEQISTVLKKCRYKFMHYFFDPEGNLCTAINQPVIIPGLKGTQLLTLRVIQTIKFKNEEAVSIKKYPYYGDFWVPSYNYWSIVPLNDSTQAVKVESSVYTEEDMMLRGMGRDTSYYADVFVHHSKGKSTFYANEDFVDNLDEFPTIERIDRTNQRTFLYSNFSERLSINEPSIFTIGLFRLTEDWSDFQGLLKFQIADFEPSENTYPYHLQQTEYFKHDVWNKTAVYSYEEDRKSLLYTDTRYKDGVKRIYAAKYKIDEREQYFEHKGTEFKIYSYYPYERETTVEVRTNNGYLEYGNFDAEYPETVFKMFITYR